MAQETRAAWGWRVERWRRSGLSACDFAEREGVNARTLAFWKWRQLKHDGVDEDAPKPARRVRKRVAFAELVPPPVVSPASDPRGAPIEVMLPIGYRVRIAPGFERSALVELLDVLEARR